MKTIIKSCVPFILNNSGNATKKAVFDTSPGYLQIHHLPVRNKAFSGYFLDCENPCPEICKRTVSDNETVLEIFPVPLPLHTTCVIEKSFMSKNTRCVAKLSKRSGCYFANLDSPDFCETFVCNPLSEKVTLEIYEIGAPLVGIIEDNRHVTLFSCDNDFKTFLSADCSDIRYSDQKLVFRRYFSDSRHRFEDLCIRSDNGLLAKERVSSGFRFRKKFHSELIPFYFLESLTEGFDEEAREYLDDSLKDADLNVMREYFGECERVRLVDNRFALESEGRLRFYTFDMNADKISNFSDVK